MRRLAALAVTLAIVACSGDDTSPDDAAPTTTVGPAPTTTTAPPDDTTTTVDLASTGFACAEEPGSSEGALESGGLERHYRLEVPPALTGPAPLILNLHGFGSNSLEQALYSRLPEMGAERGVIVVTPDGQGDQLHWNFLPAPADEADDYEFLAALLDTIAATGCVDTDRVYAAGISNGSAMSAFLACAFNDRLAAVGLVAATVQPVGCAAGEAMPVISFHGTDDALVPYTGGAVSGIPTPAAEEAMASWATQDGCTTTPIETSIADDVTLLEYPNCPDGLALQLYRIEGGGHTWPGSINVQRLGVTTDSIDATLLMFQFFAAHTLSGR